MYSNLQCITGCMGVYYITICTMCIVQHERRMYSVSEHKHYGRVHHLLETTTQQQRQDNETFPSVILKLSVERGNNKKKSSGAPGDLLPSFNQQSGNLEKKGVCVSTPTHTTTHTTFTHIRPLWEAGGGNRWTAVE